VPAPQRYLTMLGAGGYVTLSDNLTAFNFETRDFAFSMWLRYGCTSVSCPLLTKRYDCIRGNFFNMWFPSDSHARFETDDGMGSLLTADYMSYPVDGAWHFVMFVRNSTGVAIFVDGVLGEFGSGVAKNISNGVDLVAGAWDAAQCPQYSVGFVGDLADVRAFVDDIRDAVMLFVCGTRQCLVLRRWQRSLCNLHCARQRQASQR
jgi:hypothetical protein